MLTARQVGGVGGSKRTGGAVECFEFLEAEHHVFSKFRHDLITMREILFGDPSRSSDLQAHYAGSDAGGAFG